MTQQKVIVLSYFENNKEELYVMGIYTLQDIFEQKINISDIFIPYSKINYRIITNILRAYNKKKDAQEFYYYIEKKEHKEFLVKIRELVTKLNKYFDDNDYDNMVKYFGY